MLSTILLRLNSLITISFRAKSSESDKLAAAFISVIKLSKLKRHCFLVLISPKFEQRALAILLVLRGPSYIASPTAMTGLPHRQASMATRPAPITTSLLLM